MNKVSVFGLGKLGKPLAEHMASKGFNVIGVDVDPVKIENCEIAHTTTDYEYAVKNTDVSIIFVNTPNLDDGAFNLIYVNKVADNIGQTLKSLNKYHLIVLRSTVLPGATDEVIKRIEKVSGKKCGKDFGMIHSPEFLALGTETEDLKNPEYVLIGEHDKDAGDIYEAMCKIFMENDAPIIRTTLKNAELAKLMANNYITMKMNFANMIGEICDNTPGTDPDVISDILGHDSRIGRKFLTAGLSYGGTCFPRDNEALSYYLEQLDMDINLPRVLTVMNDHYSKIIVDKITNKLENLGNPIIKGELRIDKVLILGTSFKPNTDVVVESASIKIIQELINCGVEVIVHDPIAMENTKKVLGETVSYAENVQEAINNVDLTVLAVPWVEYRGFNYDKDKLFDCWRILK